MNSDIDIIHTNEIGIVFKWKKTVKRDKNKVQLVFRDTGFFIQPNELLEFSKCVKKAIKSAAVCPNHGNNESCRTILLETPVEKLTFAVNRTELYLLNELILGSLFNMELYKMLKNLDLSF